MNESDQLARYREWAVANYEVATHLYNVALALFVVIGVLAALLIVMAAVYAEAHRERNRLKKEVEQHSDPEYQLALIRQLGEAGRREVRRLAIEAQQAMVMTGGRR